MWVSFYIILKIPLYGTNKHLSILPHVCDRLEIPITRSIFHGKLASLVGRQCAAVNTHLGSIKVPPQKWIPLESWIETCQGCHTSSATSVSVTYDKKVIINNYVCIWGVVNTFYNSHVFFDVVTYHFFGLQHENLLQPFQRQKILKLESSTFVY